jgi:hypothetical protein
LKKTSYNIWIASGILLLFIVGLWWGFFAPAGMFFQLIDRRSDEVLLEIPVNTGDVLRLEIEHSFEHIPWFEYYVIQSDGTFLLEAISVAGYGAGIPAEMDVPTRIEDGMVWMEDIHSTFQEFKWLTSSTYMKDLSLNDFVIFDFRTLPDASLILGRVITKRGHFIDG